MERNDKQHSIDAVAYALRLDQQPNPFCTCKGCNEEWEALQAQLDHPFYKRVDDFRDEIKAETMVKAAKKYKEPFNPASWSIRQLGKHAMAENYDQGNYIVGLMEKAEELEKELKDALDALAHAQNEIEFWRQRTIRAEKPGIDPKQLKNEMDKLHGDVKGAILDIKG